jgi:hypothetical protein
MKALMILAALLLLAWAGAWVMVPGSTAGGSLDPEARGAAGSPTFVVFVEKPRMSRPIFGLLPESLFGTELRFDHATPDAEVGRVAPDRLELRAGDWDLLIETDDDGQLTAGTRLVFPIELGGNDLVLRGLPAEQPVGHLRAEPREGSDALDGDFLVELATCVHDDTGKAIDWPPAPLTVHGSFQGIPLGLSSGQPLGQRPSQPAGQPQLDR